MYSFPLFVDFLISMSIDQIMHSGYWVVAIVIMICLTVSKTNGLLRPFTRISRSVVALHSSVPASPLGRTKVKKLLEADESIVGQFVKIQGWVRTVRDQKKFSFIEINDGSSITGIQAVANADSDCYGEVSKLSTGAAAEITGTVVVSQGKGQKYEIQAETLQLVGACPPEVYPLQKKRHTQEFLRTIAHLRARTNTISAVARVRSALAYATHQFFQQEGFVYVQTPLITSSDCEGAGEMFRVTTLPLDNIAAIPTVRVGSTGGSSSGAVSAVPSSASVDKVSATAVPGAPTPTSTTPTPIS